MLSKNTHFRLKYFHFSDMNSIVLQFKEKVDDKLNFLEKEEQQIFIQFIII